MGAGIVSINGFGLKPSILVLLIIGGVGVGFSFFFELLWNFLCVGGYGELWIINSWTEMAKLIIIIGSVAVLLMMGPGELVFLKFSFFQTNGDRPILLLMVAFGGLCLVSSGN